MGDSTIYPRFLGMDDHGDFVWELASGRWTWGDNPYAANIRQRTFTPDRYLEKYGPVEPLPIPEGTSGFTAGPDTDPENPPGSAVNKASASLALYKLLTVLDGWVDGAHSNHHALDHREENKGQECWRTFTPSDVRRMVNDAARELDLSEFPKPTNPREDHVR